MRRWMPICFAATLLIALAVTVGCGAKKPEPTMSPDDPASKDVCYQNQTIAMADVFAWVDGGGRPITGATATGMHKSGILKQELICPAGGAFVFVPTELAFDCSIHGMVPF